MKKSQGGMAVGRFERATTDAFYSGGVKINVNGGRITDGSA
jgi:hypothetical protein